LLSAIGLLLSSPVWGGHPTEDEVVRNLKEKFLTSAPPESLAPLHLDEVWNCFEYSAIRESQWRAKLFVRFYESMLAGDESSRLYSLFLYGHIHNRGKCTLGSYRFPRFLDVPRTYTHELEFKYSNKTESWKSTDWTKNTFSGKYYVRASDKNVLVFESTTSEVLFSEYSRWVSPSIANPNVGVVSYILCTNPSESEWVKDDFFELDETLSHIYKENMEPMTCSLF
jgi:hypothetical protein